MPPTVEAERLRGISNQSWWRTNAFRVPLLFTLGNLAIAVSLELLGLWLRMRGGIAWSQVTFDVPLGIAAAQLGLAALWLSLGRGNPLLRWPLIFLLIGIGCLAKIGGAYVWGIALPYLAPIVAVNWPASYLIASQFFAVLVLVLVPLSYLSGWEFGFDVTRTTSPRLPVLQFSLRQILGFTLATSVSLAWIRMLYLLHADTDRLDIFSGPPLLFSMVWLSPTIIPLAAAAWMTLATRRRWIGALVLVPSLLAPSLIVELGLARYVDMHARSLWSIHSINLSAVLWLLLNLALLRACGLKLKCPKQAYLQPKEMVPVG